MPSNNSIQMIHPYSHEGMWVFDDAAVGLVQEPFVSGADLIIDRLAEQVPDARNGFILIFSELPLGTSGVVGVAARGVRWQRLPVQRARHGRLVVPGTAPVLQRATEADPCRGESARH